MIAAANRISLILATTLALASCADPDAGAQWRHPMTAWGDPDLQGRWPIEHMNGTPIERPEALGERRFLTDEEFAERETRLAALNGRYDQEIATNKMGMGHWAELGLPNRLTSLVSEPANGRIPALTAEGQRRSAVMRSSGLSDKFDSVADFSAVDRCISRGLPASMFPFMYNNGIEIIQAPGYVVMRLELIHETRVIPVDGRPPLAPAVRQWLGEPRGRFEGFALVVETTNFNGQTPMIHGPPGYSALLPTSESMRIVERFTRTSDDTIEYEISIEDPEVLTQPWKAAYPWQRDSSYEMFEYACHEDNHTIRDFITTSRYERARQATR